MSTLAISDHALLSDRHSAAVVTSDGCVAWLCFPRFDSESVFASLLDDDGGHWWIRPAGEAAAAVSREYVDGTMVLRSTYRTATGIFEITEAMEVGAAGDPHRLGEHAPHTVLRTVRCTSGRVALAMDFRPRPDYGLVVPTFDAVAGGVVVQGGPARLTLSTTLPVTVSATAVTARFTLEEGESAAFALQFAGIGTAVPSVYSEAAVEARLPATIAAWRAWSDIHQAYHGPWEDLVRHSGRVLEALSYQPTGAIVAAATTSLPEVVGGQRNWDYRYSWVRDASFTMQALWVAACPDEAHEFFEFMTTAGATSLPQRHLQIMFGVGGEHDLTERSLPHLSGWRGSAPVRVGNGAWDQPQLDVYGELLDAAFLLRGQLDALTPSTRGFLIALADAASDQWQLPDNGIWEIRGEPRHFLYSKLMCWVALDRAIALADRLDAAHRVDGWRRTAELIRAAILEEGWHPEVGAFTQSFGSPDLDASALMLPIVGFLPADDPRIRATVDAIIDGLTDERNLVSRYRSGSDVDGLAGHEGSFLLCTFWLAQVLAQGDRVTEAREVFERAIEHVNDVGLLAEEVDAETGEQLGNFPQAFSHLGLVNAAWAIQLAEGRAASR
ncbi:glycoside hydrolase family 15 protein [Agromyces bauzanensis]|uniref:Glycosyl hydrolase n=1 Tax=Agromyces bauzanensis TaxID=1308924 RepID=A0A917PLM8_9MICO|nr:glycoside hydrolase family 15 protein [Agromyces bauzanensis]GGJ83560.1 putative glycosyl hydrolase [Agromyces bauzanensis]